MKESEMVCIISFCTVFVYAEYFIYSVICRWFEIEKLGYSSGSLFVLGMSLAYSSKANEHLINGNIYL